LLRPACLAPGRRPRHRLGSRRVLGGVPRLSGAGAGSAARRAAHGSSPMPRLVPARFVIRRAAGQAWRPRRTVELGTNPVWPRFGAGPRRSRTVAARALVPGRVLLPALTARFGSGTPTLRRVRSNRPTARNPAAAAAAAAPRAGTIASLAPPPACAAGMDQRSGGICRCEIRSSQQPNLRCGGGARATQRMTGRW
jgi:hypothetical protein